MTSNLASHILVYSKLGFDAFVRRNIKSKLNNNFSTTSLLKSCKNMEVGEIPTWTAYFKYHKKIIDALLADIDKIKMDPKEVNPSLNEKVSLVQGSIANLKIDAIVNAANSSLRGGGGVDGAIHRAAGPKLLEECRELGRCDVGQAVITAGYNLPAKHVIHTVGPQGEKPALLADCYANSLRLAKEKNLRTIAFPCISTGVYGYPQRAAAEVAVKTVRDFLETNPEEMDRIIFCVFLDTDLSIYRTLLPQFFPIASEV